MPTASSHIGKKEDWSFFSLYFDAWRLYFKNFVLFWGIAVIFLVPLGVFHHVVQKNFVAPYAQPLAEYVISDEFSGMENTEVRDEVRKNLRQNFEKVINLTREKLPTVLGMSALYRVVTVIVEFFLIMALLYAAYGLFSNKNKDISAVFSWMSANFRGLIETGLRVFFYLYVFIFLGFLLAVFSLLSIIENVDPDLFSQSQAAKSLQGAIGLSANLVVLSLIVIVIGVVILLMRFHRGSMMLPLFVEKKVKGKALLEKASKLAEGQWGKIVGYTFLAALFTAFLGMLLTTLLAPIFSRFYSNISYEEVSRIAWMQKVTFFQTIYPVLLETLFFPVLIIFFYKLYRVISR